MTLSEQMRICEDRFEDEPTRKFTHEHWSDEVAALEADLATCERRADREASRREALEQAITDGGRLHPEHFREWARYRQEELGYKGDALSMLLLRLAARPAGEGDGDE